MIITKHTLIVFHIGFQFSFVYSLATHQSLWCPVMLHVNFSRNILSCFTSVSKLKSSQNGKIAEEKRFAFFFARQLRKTRSAFSIRNISCFLFLFQIGFQQFHVITEKLRKAWRTSKILAWAPFVEGPEKFSRPESHSKISKLNNYSVVLLTYS